MLRLTMLRRALTGAATAAVLVAPALPSATAADPTPDDNETLYVVTLRGPGTAGYHGPLSFDDYRSHLTDQQDATLDIIGAPEPAYRWTTALNGYAVALSRVDAVLLARVPGVARVEPDRIRRVAGTPALVPAAAAVPRRRSGGAGTVIGIVDTGIHTEHPVFANSPALGALPAAFAGDCPAAEGWSTESCNDKIVAARHFVQGFGDRLRIGAHLSAYDDDGHGTQVASLAAGDAQVSARNGGEKLGTFSGSAPDARLAIYKACWSAPDPADDGCASADVVAAIDQAVADRVDVLTVAITGSPGLDTVDLALLGATEADVFVATAAGNGLDHAGHSQPWLTTVGSTTGPVRRGQIIFADGTTLAGVMTTRRGVGPARVVSGGSIPAPGASRYQARLCTPGSLDAAGAAGRIVVCQRGEVGRVDKSAAVKLADGAGMVLVNAPGESLSSDFHAVPTLHVSAEAGAEIRRRTRHSADARASLRRVDAPSGKPRLTGWSSPGSAALDVVKPDLVAPGSALLAATSPADRGARWELLSGTSASTARISGLAARVRSAHPRWSAARVRSALVTSAASVIGEPSSLRQGAGHAREEAALHPGLVYDVPAGAYRRTLEGVLETDRLNLPSIIASRSGTTLVTRRVTNVGVRAMYYSSRSWGNTRHSVSVVPAAIRIAPGETRTFTVLISPLTGVLARPDSGWVAWTGANGIRVRIPLVTR